MTVAEVKYVKKCLNQITFSNFNLLSLEVVAQEKWLSVIAARNYSWYRLVL